MYSGTVHWTGTLFQYAARLHCTVLHCPTQLCFSVSTTTCQLLAICYHPGFRLEAILKQCPEVCVLLYRLAMRYYGQNKESTLGVSYQQIVADFCRMHKKILSDDCFMGPELWQLPCRVIFGGFCNFILAMSAHVFVSAQNPPKITIHINCYSSAPINATKVLKGIPK